MAAHPELADRVVEQLGRVLERPSLQQLRQRVLTQSRLGGETKSGDLSVNLVNEAFGLNQLLMPLLLLAGAPAGSIVGIEEPEIHLHPRAQVALCDLLL